MSLPQMMPNGAISAYVFFQNNPGTTESPYDKYGPWAPLILALGYGRQFTCDEFRELLEEHKDFFENFPGNTSFKEMFLSHVDIYCGKCQGFGGGYTWIDSGKGVRWCHICLNDSTSHDLTYWIGRLIHEGNHFSNFRPVVNVPSRSRSRECVPRPSRSAPRSLRKKAALCAKSERERRTKWRLTSFTLKMVPAKNLGRFMWNGASAIAV